MESVSIPTTFVSSFGYVYDCMGSWIQFSPLCWYWLYLNSPLLGNPLSIARNFFLLPWVLEPLSSLICGLSLSLLVCLHPFSIFLHLLCSFSVLFFFLLSWAHYIPTILYALLQNLSFYCCYCLLECNGEIPVRQLCCNVYLYVCNRHFKRAWYDDPKFTLIFLPYNNYFCNYFSLHYFNRCYLIKCLE